LPRMRAWTTWVTSTKLTSLDRVTSGARVAGPDRFYPPTVLTDVPPDSDLMFTEIFGPVAAILTFEDEDEDEVVRRANDTDWGLVGYVFTRSLDRALRVSERLETGMVGLNTGLVSNPAAPFGGVKQSGLGREGGRIGIDESWSTSTWRCRRGDLLGPSAAA
jgi:succinate-semialdehyde dehydrogenase / glutarate-semialdehyde dehydrogenase